MVMALLEAIGRELIGREPKRDLSLPLGAGFPGAELLPRPVPPGALSDVPEAWLEAPLALTGLTAAAQAALAGEVWYMTRFPFTIGRSRTRRRRTSALGCDLYLPDQVPFHISRRHCAVRRVPQLGGWLLQDLGSRLGTLVNGVRVGGPHGRNAARLLRGDNELVLGAAGSEYRFSLRIP